MSTAAHFALPYEAPSSVPNVYGAPFGGGFYAGRFMLEGRLYASIKAPKLLGEHAGIDWKTKWREATPGAQSVIDGLANTEAMIRAGGHPIADWILSMRAAKIGGFDDWYLGARDEEELSHRNLKPTAHKNYVYASRAGWYGVAPGTYNGCDTYGNGHNASSVPPGAPYTPDSPSQTLSEAFREGGPEAFERAYYWSSSEFGPALAWLQFFDDGGQDAVHKVYALRARAVRKVLI